MAEGVRLQQAQPVEAVIGRYKQVIGDGLHSHEDRRRSIEVGVAVHVLNQMPSGRPDLRLQRMNSDGVEVAAALPSIHVTRHLATEAELFVRGLHSRLNTSSESPKQILQKLFLTRRFHTRSTLLRPLTIARDRSPEAGRCSRFELSTVYMSPLMGQEPCCAAICFPIL